MLLVPLGEPLYENEVPLKRVIVLFIDGLNCPVELAAILIDIPARQFHSKIGLRLEMIEEGPLRKTCRLQDHVNRCPCVAIDHHKFVGFIQDKVF